MDRYVRSVDPQGHTIVSGSRKAIFSPPDESGPDSSNPGGHTVITVIEERTIMTKVRVARSVRRRTIVKLEDDR